MTKNNMTVSIIMPLYNCKDFVEDSIRSVIQQTYQDWELIIVDDRSSDRSVAVVEKCMKDESRIKLCQLEKNSGAAAARNHAIALAQGKYIAFLDSDDLWSPNKLEQQIAFMRENKSLLSFTAYQWISETGEIRKNAIQVPEYVVYKQLLQQNIIGCLTAIYDSSKIGKFYFDTSLDKHEDYQYWLEILKTIPHADGLNIPLAYYRIRQNSLSSNKLAAASYVWKILREYQEIPLPKAMYYFSTYIVKSFIKYYSK